ncbi:MAG: heavy metal translocating P-type ATPase [Paludibacteraceae bacterium]
MEVRTRSMLVKIAVASLLLVVCAAVEHFCPLATWQLLLLYLVPYLIVGFDTLREAAENILHRELFDENFLMSIATMGALAIGFFPDAENQFSEAVFVMLFFQIGELFESIAEGRSRRSISSLMDIRPDRAHVERDGQTETVDANSVEVGEIVLVKPGERIPIDGIVVEGTSHIDTAALTGESVPRSVQTEDAVASGCLNLSGMLRIRTTKPAGESTAAKVLALVENASEHKSKSERFVTRFARVYTPIVVLLALLLAFIPPFFGTESYASGLPLWLYRGLMFLVVSCPCALVISVPLSFFGGIGGASRQGILIKGADYLDALSKLDTVVFDKTGTLTHGVFQVTLVHPQDISETELLHFAAHVERYSNHPIAISLRQAYPDEADDCRIEQAEEIAGEGIQAIVNGRRVSVGNGKLMERIGAQWHACSAQAQGTTIHIAIDGQYAGHIVIADRIKQDSQQAIADLRQLGVRHTVMLTGDHEAVAQSVAQETGISEYHADLLPQDKVAHIERLLSEKKPNKTLAFVGDGINDAPVLARADIGIAMGALGSDAAIEAADVVLMNDQPTKIATAIRIANKTIRIAHENVYFSIGIKVAVLLLAGIGIANMWMAVLADVGVTVLAVLNSMRTLRK